MARPKFDLVVFGASSFVGALLCRYLLERHGSSGEVRWALAGRSAAKLEELRQGLGPDAAKLPILIADAADEAALEAMCQQTRVVISTVGPYALYGSELVGVCARSGTDYCDLTGEVQWIARMIDEHESTARDSGARIVHCCGFDSIPSDLGVHYLQQEARRRFDQPCQRVKLRVKAMRGGMSGGTAASMMNVTAEITKNPELRKTLANPFAITPQRSGPRQPNVNFAKYDEDASSWVGPFVMATINTRIVHRSNAIADFPWGEDFVYDEAMMTGDGLGGQARAAALASGIGGFMLASALPGSRWLVERFVIPKPGEGPSPEAQERGFFDLLLFGQTASQQKIRVRVRGDRDPGYGSTAKMLGEAGVCLAFDVPDTAGGFWTPATLLGDKLIDRLEAYAGLSFEVLED